jgi:hypothetical protein
MRGVVGWRQKGQLRKVVMKSLRAQDLEPYIHGRVILRYTDRDGHLYVGVGSGHGLTPFIATGKTKVGSLTVHFYWLISITHPLGFTDGNESREAEAQVENLRKNYDLKIAEPTVEKKEGRIIIHSRDGETLKVSRYDELTAHVIHLYSLTEKTSL